MTGEGEQLCPSCQREHAEWYAEVFHRFSAEELQARWAEDAERYPGKFGDGTLAKGLGAEGEEGL